MSKYEFISVDAADGIASITLNRPPLNVLNIPMMSELNAALEPMVGQKDLAAIVLRAEGKAFSAGVDVSDHTAEKVGEMIRVFHGIFRKLATIDALSIAVVQGAALGGGCELATFCDIVLASERAKFGQPEVQVGVFPPIAACILPVQVGIKKAVELTTLGATVKADEAQRIGLVNQVYPVEGFDAAVEEYLAQIGGLSRPVVRMTKLATAMNVRRAIMDHLEQVERLYLNDLMKLNDAHEGIAAFMEKRPPVWKHE